MVVGTSSDVQPIEPLAAFRCPIGSAGQRLAARCGELAALRFGMGRSCTIGREAFTSCSVI